MKGHIYFIFYKNELVYIGQTVNLLRRIKEHHSFKFDWVRFIECDRDKLKHYEARLIKYFKPKANRNNNPLYTWNDHPRMEFRKAKHGHKLAKRKFVMQKKRILIED